MADFDNLISIIHWLKIFVSPVILSLIIAFLIIGALDSTLGNYLGVVVITIGLAAGILWANKVRKKYGTTEFISRIDSSTELDDIK